MKDIFAGKFKKILVACVCGLMINICVHAEENITIAAYYPSPQGVYKQLRLYPASEDGIGVCSSSQDEGWVYYNDSVHGLKICTNSSGVYSFRSLSVVSGSLWNYSAGNLFPADSSWNIMFPASVSTGYQHKIKVDLVADQDMWIGNSANSIVQLGWESNNALIKGVGGGSNARGLSFFTGSESSNGRRVTINSTGSVGIGTDTPQGLLHVNGTVVFDGSMYASNANWTDIDLIPPWDDSISGCQNVQYKKVGDLVFLRGVPTTSNEPWYRSRTIFKLPPGLRPRATLRFMAASDCSVNWAVVEINPNGEVNVYSNGIAEYIVGNVALDSIVFSVD